MLPFKNILGQQQLLGTRDAHLEQEYSVLKGVWMLWILWAAHTGAGTCEELRLTIIDGSNIIQSRRKANTDWEQWGRAFYE